MTSVPISGTFYVEKTVRRVKERGFFVGEKTGRVFCKECRKRIRFVSTARRLYTRTTEDDKTICFDQKQFVEVVFLYCDCEGLMYTPVFGAPIYKDELTTLTQWR